MLKGLKNTRSERHKIRHKTNLLVEKKNTKQQKATKSKTKTGTTKQQKVDIRHNLINLSDRVRIR